MSAPAYAERGNPTLVGAARRPSRLLVVGVLLAALGMVAGWVAFQQATGGTSVVVVARPVAFGQEVGLADLREQTLPTGNDIAVVGWEQIDALVGGTAATDLVPGQVLPPDAIRRDQVPGPGNAVIGMPVGSGQLPISALDVRDEVLVLRPDDPAAPVRATVLAVGEPDSAGRRTVDLLVSEAQAGLLARAVADERALLVLVARG